MCQKPSKGFAWMTRFCAQTTVQTTKNSLWAANLRMQIVMSDCGDKRINVPINRC